jgi:hypothetical protein
MHDVQYLYALGGKICVSAKPLSTDSAIVISARKPGHYVFGTCSGTTSTLEVI